MHGDDDRVLVIGAGISGLAVAITLAQAGINATVFERADNLSKIQVGGGFTMWPNSMTALRHLGLDTNVADAGAPFEEAEFVTAQGKRIARWPVSAWARKYGTTSAFINRGDLVRVLLGAVEDERIRLGAECTGFVEDASGVTAQFAGGREERGALLIGADALNSVVRAQLYGRIEPRYVGYSLWHGYVSDERRALASPGLFKLTYGQGRFNYHHVGEGRLFWQSIANTTPGRDDPSVDPKTMLLDRHRGWIEPTEAILEATDENSIFRMDIFTRLPSQEWGEGRVTLVGDAAHPILFNMGQGAAQATEDAVVLARELKTEGLHPAALRRYESQRAKRALGVQKMSYRLGQIAQVQNPVGRWLRDHTLPLAFSTVAARMQERDAGFQV